MQVVDVNGNMFGYDFLEVIGVNGKPKTIGGSGSGVTNVTATAPLASSGGATPDISIHQSSSVDDGYLSATDWNTFNDKQDLLVSGTNIKTINGSSVLGSGNLTITTGVSSVTGTSPISSSGGANPAISIATANTSTTGALTSTDWNTFNGKQPTLVSGTSIKTINGSSVLGSGDLTISGASGIKGLHNVFGYFDSTVYGITAQLNGTSMTPVIMGANQLYTYPFFPNKSITSVSLRINVSTLGVGTNCRILIYSDNNGQPNAKLYESANLDCSTTGIKTAITSFTFTAGTVYWLCVQSSGTTSLTGIQPPALIPLQNLSSLLSVPVVTYINTSAFGSAPTTFVINNRSNSTVPMVQIYLS